MLPNISLDGAARCCKNSRLIGKKNEILIYAIDVPARVYILSLFLASCIRAEKLFPPDARHLLQYPYRKARPKHFHQYP